MDLGQRVRINDLICVLSAICILVGHTLIPNSELFVAPLFATVVLVLAAINIALARNLHPESEAPVSVLESTTEVWMRDSDGKLADVVKTQLLRINASDVVEIIDHGISSDGCIMVTEAKCDDLKVEVKPTVIQPGQKIPLIFKFLEPPTKGRKYQRRLAFRFEDSFCNDKEYFNVRISRAMATLHVIIHFHPDRPVKRAWLGYRDDSFGREGDSPYITIKDVGGKKLLVSYKVKKPKLGSIHCIWFEMESSVSRSSS
jgi:hypothetical protein